MTATTTAGGALLPMVGWRPGVKCVPEQNFNAGAPKPADIDYWQAIGCVIEYACDRNAAQAEIDALRAENERLNLLVMQGTEGRAEAAHAERYYRQAEAMLTKSERALHAELAQAHEAERQISEQMDAVSNQFAAVNAELAALKAAQVDKTADLQGSQVDKTGDLQGQAAQDDQARNPSADPYGY